MLVEVGKFSKLEVVKVKSIGAFVDGGPYGEILLPTREMTQDLKPKQEIEVFIYLDSEERLVATMRKPMAVVGECAYLKVVDISDFGAFLDWGLLKQLFVPFREQSQKMQLGKYYLVHIYFDKKSERIAASSRLNRYIKSTETNLKEGESVRIQIAKRTDLGYKVIINHQFWGILFKSDVFRSLKIGKVVAGFVKRVREDGKIDVVLQKKGLSGLEVASRQILEALELADGFLPVTDKSSPEVIYERFQMSKKSFKRGVGILYKQRIISIKKDGLRIINK